MKKEKLPGDIEEFVDKTVALVQEMQAKIDACPRPHRFVRIPKKAGRLRGMSRCEKCGVEIPDSHVLWYNFGLKDTDREPEAAARIVAELGKRGLLK